MQIYVERERDKRKKQDKELRVRPERLRGRQTVRVWEWVGARASSGTDLRVSCTIRQVLDARCAVSPGTVERPWRRFRVREREFLFVCFWASTEFLIICLWYVSLVFSLWVKSGFCIVCLASAQRKEKEK